MRPPKFEKDDENKEQYALLTITLPKETCYIEFKISEEDKQKLEKMNTQDITEDFITKHLVSEGKNGYFSDTCPKCEQPTLTKSPIVNSNQEATACSLCN
jgi:hypothetical protein